MAKMSDKQMEGGTTSLPTRNKPGADAQDRKIVYAKGGPHTGEQSRHATVHRSGSKVMAGSMAHKGGPELQHVRKSLREGK